MKHALTALTLLAAFPGLAAAETDGTLGASSTGSLNLSLEVQDQKRIQITGLQDIVQTIEKGVSARNMDGFSRSIKFGNPQSGFTNMGRICVSMDDGGLYTLNWSASALTDNQNVEPYSLLIQAGEAGSNSVIITVVDLGSVISDESGRVTDLEAYTRPTTSCSFGDPRGKISLYLSHTDSQVFDTVGTYEATITLTVSPQ